MYLGVNDHAWYVVATIDIQAYLIANRAVGRSKNPGESINPSPLEGEGVAYMLPKYGQGGHTPPPCNHRFRRLWPSPEL